MTHDQGHVVKWILGFISEKCVCNTWYSINHNEKYEQLRNLTSTSQVIDMDATDQDTNKQKGQVVKTIETKWINNFDFALSNNFDFAMSVVTDFPGGKVHRWADVVVVTSKSPISMYCGGQKIFQGILSEPWAIVLLALPYHQLEISGTCELKWLNLNIEAREAIQESTLGRIYLHDHHDAFEYQNGMACLYHSG